MAYWCSKCKGTFDRFVTAGVCPLCGVRAPVVCQGCNYTASAETFIRNGNACPKCGAIVEVAAPPPPPTYSSQKESTGTAKLWRHCLRCNNRWPVEFKLSATGHGSGTTPEEAQSRAQQSAQSALQTKIRNKEGDYWTQALCPRCGQFCKQFVERRYKSGFAAGLKADFGMHLFENGCLGLILAGILSLAVFGQWQAENRSWITIAVLMAVGIVGGALFVRRLRRLWTENAAIAAKIDAASDAELASLAIKAYRRVVYRIRKESDFVTQYRKECYRTLLEQYAGGPSPAKQHSAS